MLKGKSNRWSALWIAFAASLFLSACQTYSPPATEEEPSVLPSEEPTSASDLKPEPEPDSRPEAEAEAKNTAPSRRPQQQSIAPLAAQAAAVGAELIAGEKTGEWIIQSNDHSLRLEEDTRLAYFNGQSVYLSAPLTKRARGLALSFADMDALVRPLFLPISDHIESPLIVLDPGHGGSEDGAINEELGLVEKDLNLDVCSRLQEKLKDLGYDVLLTRYGDRQISLEDRPEVANKAEAGLFVSVHFNASLNAESEGVEVYALTPEGQISTADSELDQNDAIRWPGNENDALNIRLAYTVQSALVERLQRVDRGVRRARFHVLKTPQCPAILVEGGFLSHSEEALLVRTPVYREKLTRALASSIDAFMKEHGSFERDPSKEDGGL